MGLFWRKGHPCVLHTAHWHPVQSPTWVGTSWCCAEVRSDLTPRLMILWFNFQACHVRYLVRGLCIWDVGECSCAEFACVFIFWGHSWDIESFVAMFHKVQLTLSSIRCFLRAKGTLLYILYCMVNHLPQKELFSKHYIVNMFRLR